MGRHQPRHKGEEDEAVSRLGACAERAATDHGASYARRTVRRGVVVLRVLAALAGLRGVSGQAAVSVSAHTMVETPRLLCMQAIQAEIIERTRDLFQDIYLPDGHQRPHVLYQLQEHGNFGDVLIDRGEEKFLARLGLEAAAECALTKPPESQMEMCNNDKVQALLNPGNVTVLFTGGGNWGDVWPGPHRMRMREIKRLSFRPDMNIVTLQNSLKFFDEATCKKDANNVAAIVKAKHPTTRLTFLFRQRDSYDMAKSMYPGVDVRLVPDMAFMIGPLIRAGPEKFKYDILFLARHVGEGAANEQELVNLHETMATLAPHLTYYVGDWLDNPTKDTLIYGHVRASYAPSLRHGVIVDASVRYLSTAKVVITDRLHASILALLLDIPHVLTDGGPDSPSYGKRMMTRAAAFEASDHCTPTSLRYRTTSNLRDGIAEGLVLLDEYFGVEEGGG